MAALAGIQAQSQCDVNDPWETAPDESKPVAELSVKVFSTS